MDIGNILAWIIEKSIDGEYLNIIDVPEEGKESWEQNEKWWRTMLGACPPKPIPEGRYLYFYDSNVDDYPGPYPDAEIEDGEDTISLYKID